MIDDVTPQDSSKRLVYTSDREGLIAQARAVGKSDREIIFLLVRGRPYVEVRVLARGIQTQFGVSFKTVIEIWKGGS